MARREAIAEIHEIATLAGLADWLDARPAAVVREALSSEFLSRCCRYEDALQWNRAVRVCEGLAIVGWGELEPVEAIGTLFWSGNPETFFQNRFDERRFVDAVWSKHKHGLSIDASRSTYFASRDLPEVPAGTVVVGLPYIQAVKLQTQRNWIPRNPVRVSRTSLNCLPGSEALNLDVEYVLRPMLDRGMRPEAYGTTLCQILLEYSLVFDLPASAGKTDPSGATSLLRDPPYKFGGFNRRLATQRASIFFAREFSLRSTAEQKRELSRQLRIVLDMVVLRLHAKRLKYDFDAMQRDFEQVVSEWSELDSSRFLAELPDNKNHYAMFRKLYGRSP